jgi:hypothetical protein
MIVDRDFEMIVMRHFEGKMIVFPNTNDKSHRRKNGENDNPQSHDNRQGPVFQKATHIVQDINISGFVNPKIYLPGTASFPPV